MQQKQVNGKNLPQVTELKEEFRPPEWLTGTIPRKTPYVPQMGDEVMYFRQGHELYLQAVLRHNAYEINPNMNQPWHKIPNLRVSANSLHAILLADLFLCCAYLLRLFCLSIPLLFLFKTTFLFKRHPCPQYWCYTQLYFELYYFEHESLHIFFPSRKLSL